MGPKKEFLELVWKILAEHPDLQDCATDLAYSLQAAADEWIQDEISDRRSRSGVSESNEP